MSSNLALNTFCYISEQTSFEEDYANEFNYIEHKEDGRFYLIFEAVLQSFGVRNRNRREYDANNIWNLIQTDDYIQSMLRQNSWMGEIDHPSSELQGHELTMQRIANPDLKLTSHYIRRPRLNGNLLEATIQTDSSNPHGMNMAIKIKDGKIIPCFSARVLGALTNVSGRPVVNVRKLICYDWVLYPSHPEAMGKIKQPIMESVSDLEKYTGAKVIFLKEFAQKAANNSREAQVICESFGLDMNDVIGLTNTGNSIVMKQNKNLFVQPITDKEIRQKTQLAVNDWLHR